MNGKKRYSLIFYKEYNNGSKLVIVKHEENKGYLFTGLKRDHGEDHKHQVISRNDIDLNGFNVVLPMKHIYKEIDKEKGFSHFSRYLSTLSLPSNVFESVLDGIIVGLQQDEDQENNDGDEDLDQEYSDDDDDDSEDDESFVDDHVVDVEEEEDGINDEELDEQESEIATENERQLELRAEMEKDIEVLESSQGVEEETKDTDGDNNSIDSNNPLDNLAINSNLFNMVCGHRSTKDCFYNASRCYGIRNHPYLNMCASTKDKLKERLINNLEYKELDDNHHNQHILFKLPHVICTNCNRHTDLIGIIHAKTKPYAPGHNQHYKPKRILMGLQILCELEKMSVRDFILDLVNRDTVLNSHNTIGDSIKNSILPNVNTDHAIFVKNLGYMSQRRYFFYRTIFPLPHIPSLNKLVKSEKDKKEEIIEKYFYQSPNLSPTQYCVNVSQAIISHIWLTIIEDCKNKHISYLESLNSLGELKTVAPSTHHGNITQENSLTFMVCHDATRAIGIKGKLNIFALFPRFNNCMDPQSAYSVIRLNIYRGSETKENLKLYNSEILEQMKDIEENGIILKVNERLKEISNNNYSNNNNNDNSNNNSNNNNNDIIIRKVNIKFNTTMYFSSRWSLSNIPMNCCPECLATLKDMKSPNHIKSKRENYVSDIGVPLSQTYPCSVHQTSRLVETLIQKVVSSTPKVLFNIVRNISKLGGSLSSFSITIDEKKSIKKQQIKKPSVPQLTGEQSWNILNNIEKIIDKETGLDNWEIVITLFLKLRYILTILNSHSNTIQQWGDEFFQYVGENLTSLDTLYIQLFTTNERSVYWHFLIAHSVEILKRCKENNTSYPLQSLECFESSHKDVKREILMTNKSPTALEGILIKEYMNVEIACVNKIPWLESHRLTKIKSSVDKGDIGHRDNFNQVKELNNQIYDQMKRISRGSFDIIDIETKLDQIHKKQIKAIIIGERPIRLALFTSVDSTFKSAKDVFSQIKKDFDVKIDKSNSSSSYIVSYQKDILVDRQKSIQYIENQISTKTKFTPSQIQSYTMYLLKVILNHYHNSNPSTPKTSKSKKDAIDYIFKHQNEFFHTRPTRRATTPSTIAATTTTTTTTTPLPTVVVPPSGTKRTNEQPTKQKEKGKKSKKGGYLKTGHEALQM